MSVQVTYYVHGTTVYNEQGIASGQADIPLSAQGIEDALKLGRMTQDLTFDAVFTSDLPRAVQTTELAFGDRYPIIHEPRLREVNDGNITGTLIKEMPKPAIAYIDEPYPNGESYKDVERRIASLLAELKKNYDGKHVAFMSHQAPQLALEVLLNGKTWEQAFAEDWRKTKAWQAGWNYTLEKI